jgi:hypothetical protein
MARKSQNTNENEQQQAAPVRTPEEIEASLQSHLDAIIQKINATDISDHIESALVDAGDYRTKYRATAREAKMQAGKSSPMDQMIKYIREISKEFYSSLDKTEKSKTQLRISKKAMAEIAAAALEVKAEQEAANAERQTERATRLQEAKLKQIAKLPKDKQAAYMKRLQAQMDMAKRAIGQG